MSLIRTLKQHKLLLDTHIWIWLMSGDKVFKPSFLRFLGERKDKTMTSISPISIWEVGVLVEKNRIQLEMDRLEWVESALEYAGFEVEAISPRIAVQSSRLPGDVHGDPADRLLISTAHEKNYVLVTCDQKILRYGKDRYIDVYNPCKS